jgi:sulfur carrier protein ThiS
VVLLRRVSVAGAIVIVAAVVGTLLARELVRGGARASLAVTVAGRSAHVVEGTTLAGAAARFGLHPRAGDVLDVNGQVLRAGAVAGSFLVDGRLVSAETRLRSGDRITVADAHDRREPLVRRVVRITGMANNPQFTVSHTPGEQVIINGALSHELASVQFRPSGPARVERAVALTFDDGPSPQYTPRILAALTKLRVRATFFVIGYLAEANPYLVRQELRLGTAIRAAAAAAPH